MNAHAFKPGLDGRCIEGLHRDRSGISCGKPASDPIHTGQPKASCLDQRKLTSAQAAERAGVKAKTWSGYVARGQAPPADGATDPYDLPWWWDATVDRWTAARNDRRKEKDPK